MSVENVARTRTLTEEFVKDSSLLSDDKGYIALNKLCAYNIYDWDIRVLLNIAK